MVWPQSGVHVNVWALSNLTLNGQTLSYEYSPLAAAIASKAEKQIELNIKFEPSKNSPINRKEALTGASRSLWLRVVVDLRTAYDCLSH